MFTSDDTGEPMVELELGYGGARYIIPQKYVKALEDRETKTVWIVSYTDAYGDTQIRMFKNKPKLVEDSVCIDYKEVEIRI